MRTVVPTPPDNRPNAMEAALLQDMAAFYQLLLRRARLARVCDALPTGFEPVARAQTACGWG